MVQGDTDALSKNKEFLRRVINAMNRPGGSNMAGAPRKTPTPETNSVVYTGAVQRDSKPTWQRKGPLVPVKERTLATACSLVLCFPDRKQGSKQVGNRTWLLFDVNSLPR